MRTKVFESPRKQLHFSKSMVSLRVIVVKRTAKGGFNMASVVVTITTVDIHIKAYNTPSSMT